jgi:ABC-2 type transport system ATP-binding protein
VRAVEIRGLAKDYASGSLLPKTRRVLHPFELDVEEGETFGLIGPNGAGKTTTLKLLMGLVFPTEGEARILGRPLGAPEMKQQIGYLPEQPYFYDYLTGASFELLRTLFGLSRERDRGAAGLEKVG